MFDTLGKSELGPRARKAVNYNVDRALKEAGTAEEPKKTVRTAKRKIWHLFLGESRRKLRAIGIESWWGSQKPAHSSLVTSAF